MTLRHAVNASSSVSIGVLCMCCTSQQRMRRRPTARLRHACHAATNHMFVWSPACNVHTHTHTLAQCAPAASVKKRTHLYMHAWVGPYRCVCSMSSLTCPCAQGYQTQRTSLQHLYCSGCVEQLAHSTPLSEPPVSTQNEHTGAQTM